MRVPLSWLRDYVDVDLEPEKLAERLTLLGMEVKGIERWGADWQNVVVGELLSVEKHPRADRLSLTRVRVGDGEPLDVVCGATNIAAGQRVPVALPGAVLPGDRRIERTEKMGVVSNGMLCSGDELNLTGDADGILILPPDAPIGIVLTELYGDVVLDVDVKPNRGDALSLVGLAREVAAINGAPLRWPEAEPVEDGRDVADFLVVDVEDEAACPRFVGRWVDGVRVGPSPDQVQMRLRAAGQRPISNVVDVSNYVMLELGKPIHTYDADGVAETDGRRRLVVRRARAGERLETIDHVARELEPETVVIADDREVLGIGGVMGGAASEVTEATTRVIVESAIFDPILIRRTGQRYGLRSEASLRFEKGVEHRLARIGADRAARLIAEWARGSVARGRTDSAPDEPAPRHVPFRPARINRLLGTQLGPDEQRATLARIGIETASGDEGTGGADATIPVALEPKPLSVTAPSETVVAVIPTWRADLAIEADIAEEIARVAGYDTIPAILPDTTMPPFRPSPLAVRDRIRETLAGAGVTETVSHALVAPAAAERYAWTAEVPAAERSGPPVGRPIRVTNPLSADHSVLRPSVVGSLVEIVGTNVRHGRDDVAIFEIGKGYGRDGETTREWWRLGLALTGAGEPPAWNRPRRAMDADDAKGLVELVARRLGFDPPTYEPLVDEPLLHPGRAARVLARRNGSIVLAGVLGELHPAVADAEDLRVRVVVAELDVTGLGGGTFRDVRAAAPSRQPAAERDLAIVVPEALAAARVADAIRSAAGAELTGLELFDIYRGAPLGGDEKSLAWRLVLQAEDRTLTEPEIEASTQAITAAIEAIGGRIRT